MTHYFHVHRNHFDNTWYDFIPILIPLIISTLLVLNNLTLEQPLLSFALRVCLTLWLAGIPKKFFLYNCVIGVCLCMPVFWRVLKPYQKTRVLVFLGQGNITKERYQIEQAKIAIGSGGITGKGFLQGTQNKFCFVPKVRTDFIFAVLCEELGFLGAAFLLLLYVLLFLRLFSIVQTIKHPDPKLFAAGLVVPIMLSTSIKYPLWFLVFYQLLAFHYLS